MSVSVLWLCKCLCVRTSSSANLLKKRPRVNVWKESFWEVSARCCGYMLAHQILWVNMLQHLVKKSVLSLSDCFTLHHIHRVETWGFAFSDMFLFCFTGPKQDPGKGKSSHRLLRSSVTQKPLKSPTVLCFFPSSVSSAYRLGITNLLNRGSCHDTSEEDVLIGQGSAGV